MTYYFMLIMFILEQAPATWSLFDFFNGAFLYMSWMIKIFSIICLFLHKSNKLYTKLRWLLIYIEIINKKKMCFFYSYDVYILIYQLNRFYFKFWLQLFIYIEMKYKNNQLYIYIKKIIYLNNVYTYIYILYFFNFILNEIILIYLWLTKENGCRPLF